MKTAIITIESAGTTVLHKGGELPYSEAKIELNKLRSAQKKDTRITLWTSVGSKSFEYSPDGSIVKFSKKLEPDNPAAKAVDAAKALLRKPQIAQVVRNPKEELRRSREVDAAKKRLRDGLAGTSIGLSESEDAEKE